MTTALAQTKPARMLATAQLCAQHPDTTDSQLTTWLQSAFAGWLGFKPKGDVPPLTARMRLRGDFQAALAVLDRADASADDVWITAALTKVALLCTRKPGGEAVTEATFDAYLSKLRELPADCVLTALAQWPDRSKWFPAWAELKEQIDTLSLYRRQCRSIIETAQNAAQRRAA